jgi:hypothetical protein
MLLLTIMFCAVSALAVALAIELRRAERRYADVRQELSDVSDGIDAVARKFGVHYHHRGHPTVTRLALLAADIDRRAPQLAGAAKTTPTPWAGGGR